MILKSNGDTKPERFCIFCGKTPEDKNKEHVVPAWLIKQTGDPSRKVSFGVSIDSNTNEIIHRAFAFDQFVFPACKKCNSEFDKIRVGLWLAMKVHHTNPVTEKPNYYIKDRMGIYDRALIVEKLKTNQKGITFTGTNSYAFHFMPSAFSIRVNEFIFTNISASNLVARRLGFPYKYESFIDPSTSFECAKLCQGTERVNSPIFLNAFLNSGLLIAQPVYRADLLFQNSQHFFESEYVKGHSIKEGVGNIFVQQNRTIKEYGAAEKVGFANLALLPEGYFDTKNLNRIFKCQLWLIKNFTPSGKYLSTDQKLYLKKKLKYVNHLTKLIWRLSKEGS